MKNRSYYYSYKRIAFYVAFDECSTSFGAESAGCFEKVVAYPESMGINTKEELSDGNITNTFKRGN